MRASTYTGRSTDIGVVYDLMIHDIDLVLSLVNAPLRSVHAVGMALLGKREDVAQARLEFANGCVANLSASRASFAPAPRRQMHIWGEQGFAAIDFGTRATHFVSPCDEVLERTFDYETLSPEEKAGFKDRLFTEILRVEPLEVESRNALLDELHDFVGSVRDAALAAGDRSGRTRSGGGGRGDSGFDPHAPMGRPRWRTGGAPGHARAVDSTRSALASGARSG